VNLRAVTLDQEIDVPLNSFPVRQKKKVRVVLHDAAKAKAWGEAGADVAIADVDEGAALERAFSGAEGVYVLLPPNFSSSQPLVDNHRRTNTIAAAVEAAGVPHVVVVLEYEVSGRVVASGATYENRFVSIVTIENRKVVLWRDYMDSLAVMRALSPGRPS
jgi:limonene-1,2-epoxide hydrolase